jgi:hypothetical protein
MTNTDTAKYGESAAPVAVLRRTAQGVDRRWLKGRLWLRHRAEDWSQYRRILRMTKRPIVISGCGRSGTRLLLSWLSAHPRIFAIAEETFALCPPQRSGNRSAHPQIEILYDSLLRSEIPSSCARWCEKTPKNVQHIARVLDYFGAGSRFINIVRDGRDVVTSFHPQSPDRYYVAPTRWVSDVSAGLAFDHHPQVLTIRYEDLVGDTEAVGRTICSFVGEEFTDALLRYPHTAKVRSNRAWPGEATKLHQKSVRRWDVERHRDVVDRLIAIPQATALLRHYGYL